MLFACPLTKEEANGLPPQMQTFKARDSVWLGVEIHKRDYAGCCGLSICYGGNAWISKNAFSGAYGYEIFGSLTDLRHRLSYLCDGIRSSLFADVENGALIGLARWVFGEDKLELVWENVNKNSGNKIFLWILRN